MYDQSLTSRAVENASARVGYDLQYHSQAQIDAAQSLLNDLVDPDRGGLKRNLAPDEQRFITNERTLCALDARYYYVHYAQIINWQKQPQLFTPNVAQAMMLDIWADLERQGRAIHLLQLKARRLGVSTLSELEVARRVQFHPFTNAVVASADPTKSLLMAEMIDFCWQRMPWWLLPKTTKVQNGMPVEFGEINTGITIQAGNQFNGVARGATPNVYHVCFAPETLVRTANGSLTSVRDLRAGDITIAQDGFPTRVKAVVQSHRKNELTADLWMWGSFAPLRTTRDHRVLTPEGWREAGTLKSGDELVYPVRPIVSDKKECAYERWSPGRHHQRKIKIETKPLDRTFGYFLGLYLSEGTAIRNLRLKDPNLQPSAIVITCDQDEVDPFTKRIKEAVGVDAHVGLRRATSRTCQLQYSNSGLARWIVEHFGSVDTKRVPDWAWSAGREFCLGLIDGYIDGDGHYAEDTTVSAPSIRLALPIQMRELIASLGFGWSGIQYRSAGIYYERNCQAQWTIHINGDTARKLRKALGKPMMERDPQGSRGHWRYLPNGHLAIEIATTADGYSDEFYDVEVEHVTHAFTTLQGIVKNSEIAEWVDAEALIDGALLRAIIDTPDVFGIIEGTGEGRGNFLHKTWELIKQEWPMGRSRQMPVFLPWYVGTDIYPSPAERRSRPIPTNWIPSDRTIRQAERAREYVTTNPLLLKHLAKGHTGWTMPREQMWYHEVEYESSKLKKTLNIFLAEMASDDFDAFQSSNLPVVDQEILMNYRDRTRNPVAVYTIIGDSIPPTLSVPKRDWLRGPDAPPPITIRVANVLPRTPLVFQFVPVRFDGYSGYDPTLKLLLWEYPEDGESYGLGVDTSDGIGQDNSVIEVLRKAGPNRCDAQVAEFASAYVKAFQLWPMVMAIGCFYSVHNPKTNTRPQCRVAIECRGNGEACQHELQKRGWRNFHPWKRYDNKQMTKDADVQKFGIYTNVWFRPQMMDMLLTLVDEEALDLPSPYIVKEFEALERDERLQKAKAAYGERDDRVMGIGFPLFSMHVGERPSQQFARRKVEILPGGEAEEVTEYPIWQPPMQALSTGFVPSQSILRGRGGRPNGLHRLVNRSMPKGFR